MVTGVECAGLALAVLPLVIEIAKVYPRGIGTIKDTVQSSRYDTSLEEFYEELFCQMWEFQERIRHIVDHLPGISEIEKDRLSHQYQEKDWKPGTNVAKAFAQIFPGQGELFRFETVVKTMVKQLGQLVSDRSVYLSKTDAASRPRFEFFMC
jgi:hypothetical protein